jgi:spore coat protein H
MLLRTLTIAMILLLTGIYACGTGRHAPSPASAPDAFHVTAFDAAGVELPATAARVTTDGPLARIEAHDPRVAGVELGFDGAARQVAEVRRGDYFSGDDLFLSVDHIPRLVAVGGYHFAPAQVPGLLAEIEFGSGQPLRTVSALPTAATCTPLGFDVRDAGDGTALLSWQFQSLGDYNQDGEVGVSDLTPIGQNFNLRAGDAGWDTAALADGNRDGFITASDLTPVGANYQVQVTGYIVETAAAESGPFSAVGDPALLSSGVKDPVLEFSHTVTTAVDGNYYRVRAYHSSDTTRGAASPALQFNALDPGANPVAAAAVDTNHGEAPLSCAFSAAGSSDSDGSIAQYLWDFDGDGAFEFDASTTSGSTTKVFSAAGTYMVRLKVIDDDGRWDSDELTVYVTGPGAADPPEAYAHAMPHQGWAPLTVYASAYGTTDNGTVTALEWDFDGDGTYETDATSAEGYANHTFTTAGNYNVNLRATDDHGNQSVDTVVVEVRDKQQSSVDYWMIFDQSSVGYVKLEVQQADWDQMWDNVEAELEIPSTVTVFGETLVDCGLKFKGNGSLWGSGDKKPWKVDVNEFVDGQEYQNLKMLLFNNNFEDPSMLREKMAYDMLQFAGVDAGFTRFVEVWIDIHGDGVEPIYWGVYTMVERVDKKFLANRFGQENDGDNLYKADAWFEEGGADLAYYGEDIEDYPKPRGEIAYGKETNSGENDYSDIIELCRVIDGTEYDSEADFCTALEGVLNVDSFLRYMACMVVCDNWDCYPFSANNYYLYHDPVSDRFQWIPWDENSAWSGEAHRPLVLAGEWGGPVEYAPLQRKVFVIEKYLRDYAAYIDLLRRHWFSDDKVATVAEGWYDMLEPYVKQDTGDKMYYGSTAAYPVSAFDTNWQSEYAEMGRVGIVDFTEARGAYIDGNLAGILQE